MNKNNNYNENYNTKYRYNKNNYNDNINNASSEYNNFKREYNQRGRMADSIDEMISNFEFENINDVVKSSVDFALREVSNSNILNVVNSVSGNLGQHIAKYQNNMSIKNSPKHDIEMYSNKPQGYVMYIILQIVSYILSSLFFMLGIVFGILSLKPAIFFITSGVFLGIGIFSSRQVIRITRFKKYLKYFETVEFDDIKNISRNLKIKKEKVLGDLKYMMSNNIFSEAHLVENNSIFILNNQCYEYYNNSIQMKIENEKEQNQINSNKELQAFIQDTSVKITELNKYRNLINSDELKNEVQKIIVSSERIVETVKKSPEQLTLLARFSTYYLPTTIKLLKTYDELEENPDRIESSNEAKKQIFDTLKTLSEAFDKLLNQLVGMKKMDINADISVLNTLLSQDGLK